MPILSFKKSTLDEIESCRLEILSERGNCDSTSIACAASILSGMTTISLGWEPPGISSPSTGPVGPKWRNAVCAPVRRAMVRSSLGYKRSSPPRDTSRCESILTMSPNELSKLAIVLGTCEWMLWMIARTSGRETEPLAVRLNISVIFSVVLMLRQSNL